MRKRALATVVSLAAAIVTISANEVTPTAPDSAAVRQPVSTGQSVGLVLSGGGAKGIAEIGAIQALEDNNIPIDYIAGTSMGAIVGGLYACGYTPAEMMDMIASKDFQSWSSGVISPDLTYYFLKQTQTPAFANISVKLGKDSTDTTPGILPASLISPLPMNFAFMDLFAGYTAQCGGNFDGLFVPFRCVTSDIMAKKKIVCRSGHLSDAIRASMSFPCVFAPIKMNGVYVYDGGLYDNFPVDVMREDFAPDIMIGLDVHSPDKGPQPHNIVTTIENMAEVAQDYELPESEGVKVHIDVSQYGLLDWGKAQELYDAGYKRCMELMDTIRARVTSRETAETRRLRRAVFKSQSPYVRFDSVHASGGTRPQDEYLEHLFKPEKVDTFGIERARRSYYRALTPGTISNLIPHANFNPKTGLFTLNLDAQMRNAFSIGAGGYLSSSPNSYIFLSADYASMSYRSTRASLMGWIGQSYMAAKFNGRIYLNSTNTPTAFELEAVYGRRKYYESDKLFYEENSPAFITNYTGFGRVYYSNAVGANGKFQIGIGGGQDRNSFYSSEKGDFSISGKARTQLNIGQALTRIEFNTLNNQNYPSHGYRFNITAMYNLGKYHYKKNATGDDDELRFNENLHWFQAEGKGEYYMTLSDNVALGFTADLMLSTRKLLNTYYASVVNAPAFAPTVATETVFNSRFRANSFVAAGVVPIWTPFKNAQLRLSTNVFLPARRIEVAEPEHNSVTTMPLGARWGAWFRHPEFIGELDAVYNLPFASVSGYVNYLTFPARNWNAGISFGLYFTAGDLLR